MEHGEIIIKIKYFKFKVVFDAKLNVLLSLTLNEIFEVKNGIDFFKNGQIKMIK